MWYSAWMIARHIPLVLLVYLQFIGSFERAWAGQDSECVRDLTDQISSATSDDRPNVIADTLEELYRLADEANQTYSRDLVRNKVVYTHPQVLNPNNGYSSRFISDHWDLQPGMRVLDMGTGTGVLAFLAHERTGVRVDAVDINPFSAEAVNLGAQANGMGQGVVFHQSDLFDQLPPGQYDRIIFPMPYHDHAYQRGDGDWLEKATVDPEYRALKRLLVTSSDRLNKGGKLLLCFSSMSTVDHVVRTLERCPLSVEPDLEAHHLKITRYLYSLSHGS